MADRNIGEELIQAAKEMKANQRARVTHINDVNDDKATVGFIAGSICAYARYFAANNPRMGARAQKAARRSSIFLDFDTDPTFS